MRIDFEAKQRIPELLKAVDEYKQIWLKDGKKIEEAITSISGFPIKEEDVKVIVYEGISFSGKNAREPMRLRASYPSEVKKAALIHELLHRHIFGFQNQEIDAHRMINLILFDIWVEVYGEEFAKEQVEIEKKRKGVYDYKSAWNFALSKTKEQRQYLWKRLTKS